MYKTKIYEISTYSSKAPHVPTMIFTSFKKLPNGRSDTSNKSKFPVLYLLVVPVVGKPLHDEVVDTVERRLLVRGVLYRHGDKSDV